MQGFSPPPEPGARQSLRDLSGHLQHLQSLYDDVQAVVANTPGAGSRRRATDPGSPGPPPSSGSSRLRASFVGSPLRQPLLASVAAGSGPSSPQLNRNGSPTRLPGPDSVLRHRRGRSTSAAAAMGAAAASGGGPASSRRPVPPSGQHPTPPAQRLDSYQRFAAQVFEERFCPLRVGLQQQLGQEEGRQQQTAEAPACSTPLRPQREQQQRQPLPREQQQQQPPLGQQQQHQGEQQWQQQWQPLLHEQQQQQPPLRDQQRQQQREEKQFSPVAKVQQRQQTSAPQEQRQQHGDVTPPRQRGFHASWRAGASSSGDPSIVAAEGVLEEGVTPPRSRGSVRSSAAASSVAASSGSRSVLSFASEEGDAVLLASPARDAVLSPAALSREGAGALGGTGQQPASSPLPMLEVALQLLSSSTEPRGMPDDGTSATVAAGDAAASAQRVAADDGNVVTKAAAAGQVHGALAACQPCGHVEAGTHGEAEFGGYGAAPCGSLQPQKLEFCRHGGHASATPEAAGASQQQGQHMQEALLQPAVHGAAAASLAPCSAAAAGSSEEAAHLAGTPNASSCGAGAERPSTASVRAQALLRLKQRRMLQRQPEEPQAGCTGNSAAAAGTSVQQGVEEQPESQASCAAEPAAAAGSRAARHTRPADGSGTGMQQGQGVNQVASGRHRQEQQDEQRGGRASPDQQQAGEQGEEEQPPQPRPFLRRRSQMVPMQKLPDWNSVRPRTSSRWEGEDGSNSNTTSSRPTTPGSTASTPGGSRASTPRIHVQHGPQQPPASSRQAGAATGRRAGSSSRLGIGGSAGAAAPLSGQPWESDAATYALRPLSPVRTASRGTGAGASAGRATQGAGGRQAQQPKAWGSNREQPPVAGGRAAGKPPQHGGTARTTPFAPRPNSGAERHQQRGQRPRGNPLYDAASLLPMSLEDLMQGGFAGGAFGGGKSSSSSSRGMHDPLQQHHGSLHAAGMHMPAHRSGGAGGGAGRAGSAAAGDCGPLDDLLSQVDRMLSQVERAIS